MVDRAHLGMGGREVVGEPRRVVLRAVVDDDDLEPVGQAGQRLERLGHQAAEIRRFVVGGEEVRQLVEARGCRSRCRSRRGQGRHPVVRPITW